MPAKTNSSSTHRLDPSTAAGTPPLRIRIAFEYSACAAQDFPAAADLAQRCQFDGVEIAWPLATSLVVSSNVEISAINLGLNFEQLASAIALTADLGCRFVRIKSDSLFARSQTVSPKMIARLLAVGDTAATAGVTILIENQPIAGSALRLWHLLDRLNHPSIACCWNTLSAARAGDAPAVAVPMLNTRIRYVHLQDAKANAGSIIPCDLGKGDLPLRDTTNRLRGIGFDGYLLAATAQTPPQEPNLLEQTLTAAHAVLQQWQVISSLISS